MDSSLAVWDARTGAVLRYLRGHKGPINDVCFLSPTQVQTCFIRSVYCIYYYYYYYTGSVLLLTAMHMRLKPT